MNYNKYCLGTSIAVATLLSLGIVSQPKAVNANVSASVQQSKLIANANKSAVSNGYTDDGFTYLNPSATSPERENSYHLNTADNWSNDLQTIIYDQKNQEYDIYYLYTGKVILGNTGFRQNWLRVTTKDFVHFSQPTVAIKDLHGDIDDTWGSAWTGTIITNNGQITDVPKGAKVAYFSGLRNKDYQQNIWAAWSDDDGKTFSHPLNDKKPILDHSWPGVSIDPFDERDPAVFYWQDKLIMYTAEGSNIGVYQSTDGLKWTMAKANQKDSKIPSSDFLKGLPFEAPIECPVVRSMKTADGQVKQVLFVGAKAPNAGQTTGTYYTVGHLDKDGIFVPETDAKRLDQGTDYYGANFNGSDDLAHADSELITMGWVGNWSYTNSGIKANQNGNNPDSTRLGAYTLARKLTLNNDLTIANTPITEGLETGNITKKSGKVGQQAALPNKYYDLLNLTKQPANSKYKLHFSTNNGANYQGSIKLEFTQGKDHNVIIFDPATGKYRIDGESSELSGEAAKYYRDGLADGRGYLNDSGLKDTKDFTLTLYTDKTSIELFFSNGQAATMGRFCVNNVQDVKISAQDDQQTNQFDVSYQEVGPKLIGYEGQSKPTSTVPDEHPNNPDKPTNNKPTSVPEPVLPPIDQPTRPTITQLETGSKQPIKEEPKPDDKVTSTSTEPKSKATKKTVMHTAYVYDQAGKKTVQKVKAGKTVKTYGTKSINGKKYYVLANDQFLAAGNIDGTKRKLKHNAYVYNQHGKRIKGKHLKRNKQVRTYGSSVKLHGKRYYLVGKEQYVKRANFK
ncbi:SLAP domain-containing protein [Lactobacillus sp. ESL0681]|uniref:SLAP domain-containing protein n=1 Tax=Lactobacillus sp. ESL0681 TaxID=2983211 RepID=UPI0023F854E9|nr:SLAP domain-containing protein [Lactobacillus sp. ESL0681]WEV39984.1 SLAP domain-containing protein [Lactobacillus sp. ESL0681]